MMPKIRKVATTIVAGFVLVWPQSPDGGRLSAGDLKSARGGQPAGEEKVTELGKVAATVKPGTWAELKTEGYTADLLRVQNHHILEYTGAAAWDPTSRQCFSSARGITRR